MRHTTSAIVLGSRSHGEHGAVVRLLTPGHGLQAAYVRGARGRRMRPVLIAGNLVEAQLSARTDTQLPQAAVELIHSRGPLLSEALSAAAIDWVTALPAYTLPEQQSYPRIYSGLSGLLDAIEAAPSAAGWAEALVRFELLLLAELGFGLDLSRCAVTGSTADLTAVSPSSGRAISAVEAEPFADRVLPLPSFLLTGRSGGWADSLNGLRLTGHFLARDVFIERADLLLAARSRLVDRLHRAAGLA